MAYTAENIASRERVVMHDFDPDATIVTAVEWRPVEEFRHFFAKFMRTVGTSALTFDIAAATDASGTGATAVVTHAVGSEPDAVEDQIFLECDAEQILDAVAGATHWSARLSFATGTDEGVVTTIESAPLYPRTGLTADSVA